MARWTDRFAHLWAGPRRVPFALTGALSAGEEKASRVGAVIAMETLGWPVWTPRDYQTFAREGYMQNPIVYRSVRMIAEAAASIPLILYEGSQEHETHPLLDLIRQPNAIQTSADFFECWYGYLLVSGNSYSEAVVLNERVRELHTLRPDRMTVIPGREGWPEGFEYTANGASVRFAADADAAAGGVSPILHMSCFIPRTITMA